jgi:hypothetical protein
MVPRVDLGECGCQLVAAMNHDLTKMLQAWPYQPGQVMARRFKGRDGLQKIQLRVDLGVLHMNAEGRPDGKRPMGQETWFDVYRTRLAEHLLAKGTPESFQLGLEECSKLQQECIQFHHRYICLFQLEDYEAVERDSERNLEVFEFVAEHAATEDLAWSLLQFVPQLLLMRTRSRGTEALKANSFEQAVLHIQEGISELERFYHENERLEMMEASPELASLREWLNQVQNRRPLSEKERLERDLAEAIRLEDYERAARVRDQIRKMQASGS